MGYEYYDYSYDVGSTLGGIIAGMTVFVIALVFLILMFIGQWKCFKKAGYNGWESLITGHNQFVNCIFAGVNPILVIVLTFGYIVAIIPVIGFLAYIGFIIYYQFVVGINTAKAFGKGTGFGVALAIPLSSPIAWFILGKDDIKYVGVKNGNNVQQNNSQVVYNTQQPVQPVEQSVPVQPLNNEPQPTNCKNCGAPVTAGDKFCMSCGTQI